jgi:alkylmercury lyase
MADVSRERVEEILAESNATQESIGIPEGIHALLLGTYRMLLAKGRPIKRDELAQALDLSIGGLNEGLAKLPGLDVDDDGNIFGVMGLTLEKTRCKAYYGDRTVYGWCAADTLFVARLLDRIVHVETTDPVTGRKVEITVSPDGIERQQPEGLAMSAIAWNRAGKAGAPSSAEIRANVCDYIFFFESRASAESWVAEHPATFVMTAAEIVELVRIASEQPLEELLMGQS